MILVKDFISQYNNGYFKPNTRDFDHQIEDYKSTMSGLSGKTTAIKMILKGNRIYGDLIKQTLLKMSTYTSNSKEVVKYHQNGWFFMSLNEFCIKKAKVLHFLPLSIKIHSISSFNCHSIKHAPTQDFYEHVFMYYQTHKKDKHFDLKVSYLNQLLLDQSHGRCWIAI